MRGWGEWGAMDVTGDGRRAALARLENGETYIDLHELPSRRRTVSWAVGRKFPWQLLFSPDGKSLFGWVVQGQLYGYTNSGSTTSGQIWDTRTGGPTSSLIAHTGTATYTPGSDRLVTLTDSVRLVRDAADGRVMGSAFPDDGEYQRVVAPHPDGRTLLTPSEHSVRLWQISPHAEAAPERAAGTRSSVGDDVRNVQAWGSRFSLAGLRADGQTAISLLKGAGGGERIRLSDTATGRPIGRPLSHNTGWKIFGFAFSPGGRFVATGSDPNRVAGEVRLWDANTGRLLLPPMPHTNYVSALAFRPDSKILAAGDYNGLVRFWDTSTGREIGRPLSQGEIVWSLAYSPDGKMLAVGLTKDRGKPGVRLWDTRTSKPIGELLPSSEGITRIEFRPDGLALLASTQHQEAVRTARLWDTTRGQAIGKPMVDEAAGGFRPDGRAFVTLGRDGTVKLRDATSGEVLASILTSSAPATCAAFRGDGGLVAAGFEDGAVRLADLATNQPVGPPRFLRHAVHQVAFTSDGRTVVAIDGQGEFRSWPVPQPLQDSSLEDLTLRIEARTGLHMETSLATSRLGATAWSQRLEQLRNLDRTAVQLDDGPAWHEPMVREAEQKGNAFAARWHLDRLIAVRPDDWFLYARRARAWALFDKFDKAAADYLQAERLGSREQILDFQTHCAIDCTAAERWAEALWYLDRLIAARPDDGSLHEDRAAVYGKLGREADRQAELARVFELGADQGLVMPRAEELGRAGNWAEAAGLLARCGRTRPLSRELAQAWGIACLRAGDRAGYREACAADMACNGPNPTVVWNELSAASLLALAPGAIDDYRVPMAWLEKRLSATPAPGALYRHYLSNALGGLLLRAGRIDEAIARLKEGIAVAKEAEGPGDWAYLALAHARKGETAEARRRLERLRTWRPDSSASFWDIEELALLRNEAESLFYDAEFPRDPFQATRPKDRSF